MYRNTISIDIVNVMSAGNSTSHGRETNIIISTQTDVKLEAIHPLGRIMFRIIW